MSDKMDIFSHAAADAPCVNNGHVPLASHWLFKRLTDNDHIGVNRPAIVREIPHFGLFPAFLPESETRKVFIRSSQKVDTK